MGPDNQNRTEPGGAFSAPLRGHRVLRGSLAGFTFIEVIVTAVIVAILAATAIPVYTSYINTQRQNTIKSLAQMTAAAANIYVRRTNASPNCGNTAACVTMLGIFVSDPAQFEIRITGGNTVTVTDHSHGDIYETARF